ncbi:MAG: NAD-dependent epimerase/dehydratase family protein, partial [bacterium]|nr:NAD-dependent epimerase/dehydratase family protein [bacterium]
QIRNLKKALKNSKFHLIKSDVRDYDRLLHVTTDIDVIFHEAALTSVSDSIENPEKFKKVNAWGTRNLLEACRKNEVKKVILASSAAVYGDTDKFPITEESSLNPISPYAESKVQNEKDAKEHFEEYGLETVSLRYFNAYGPGQDPKSPYSGVISKFMDCAIEGKQPTIYGEGEQTRDFVFVEDVVNANLLAMKTEGIGGEVFNIATGKETSVLDLWEEIKGSSGFDSGPLFAPRKEGDILRSVASIEKAKTGLDYEPKYSINEGLKKTMEWVKNAR